MKALSTMVIANGPTTTTVRSQNKIIQARLRKTRRKQKDYSKSILQIYLQYRLVMDLVQEGREARTTQCDDGVGALAGGTLG